jgi:hypothetical protein
LEVIAISRHCDTHRKHFRVIVICAPRHSDVERDIGAKRTDRVDNDCETRRVGYGSDTYLVLGLLRVQEET